MPTINPDELAKLPRLPMPEDEPPPLTGHLADAFLPEAQPEQEPQPEAPPAETAYQTGLKLSEVQRDAMVRYGFQRMWEIMEDMGLDKGNQIQIGSWMAIRNENQKSYEGDHTWRMALEGSVFQTSNLSLGSDVRHNRYLSARVQDDLMGTTPFFAALGRNSDKEELARQTEQWVQQSVDKSLVRQGIRRAQKSALIVNEAVVKVSWVKDSSPYKGEATVLVDQAGEPIITPEKKLLIYEGDNFLPNPNILQPGQEDPETQQVDSATGECVPGSGLPVPPGPRAVVLEKDSSFEMVEGTLEYKAFPDLAQELVIYEGPRAEPVHYTCFLCPLEAEDIHAADMIGQLFMQTPLKMKENYGEYDVGRDYWDTVTGDKQPKIIQGERVEPRSSVYQRGQFAELYFRMDADGDGRAEEIFMVVDINRQKAVFYDYLANHWDRRPFEVIVGVEEIPNRWYGRGVRGITRDVDLQEDAEYNRANIKGARSSQISFRHPNATEEWRNGLPTILGGDKVYDLVGDFNSSDNPPFFTVSTVPENEKALELMEISTQRSDTILGTISAKDASESDLNQSKTATGIVNLQEASDVITKATEQDQVVGINAVLWQVVKLTLKMMPEKAIILSKDTSQLITLNRDEIRSLEQDVRLTLTRSRSLQQQQVSQAAIQIGMQYDQLLRANPRGAKRMRQLFVDQLKALEVNDADEICPEVTDEMIAQFDQAQQMAAQQQQEPPKESISVKLGDLAGSERDQALKKFGIKADEKAHEKAAKDESKPARKAA